MSDQNAAAVEGSVGIGISDLMAALDKALDAATEDDKDKIRRKLGITAPEAPTAGNGQTPGTTVTSETAPARPAAADNRFTISNVTSGTVLSIVATLLGVVIVFILTGLSNTVTGLSNTMEARFAEQATRISGLENRLDNRISALENKYDAKIDALIKTVTDMRVDIGKLQALMTGQLAPAGDTERPRTPDDSAGTGYPGRNPPSAAGPEPRL
ncbi:MAG: hypothetical protein LBQ79_03245 [Deltaproteobacteria bacterium]|jgi:hypothetical protein|nr:hypothetical protein [Deltaproteobacteria bacterium]